MQANRPLNEYLPLRFRNGEQVRQFSKPCLQCGKMLHAKSMKGVACLLNDQIAIAAQAQCPSCAARFPVTCLINENKQVRRVIMPYFLFNPYLRLLAPAAVASASANKMGIPEAELPDTPIAAMPASVVAKEVIRAEEAVGRYQDKPIPAWVQVDGKRYEFQRITFEARAGEGEFLLDGHLIYRN